MNNVISFIDGLVSIMREEAPGSQSTSFLIGVAGQFGVRGVVNAGFWVARPSIEDERRLEASAALAAYAFRVLGDAWLVDAIKDAIEYKRIARPVDVSKILRPTKAGIFGNLAEKAASRSAGREEERVAQVEDRKDTVFAMAYGEITRHNAVCTELDCSLVDTAAVTLLGSLFSAAQGCAINAEMRKANRMPAIATAAVLEVGALQRIGVLLNNETAKLLGLTEGGYVPEYELTSADAWADRREEGLREELDGIASEVAARTPALTTRPAA